MKKTLFLLPTLALAVTLAASSTQAQTFAVGYNFAGLPGANGGKVAAPVAATATDPSLTLSGLTRDHGFGENQYTPNYTNYSFGVNPGSGNTSAAYQATAAAAHADAQDVTFTLTPTEAISLTSLSFGVGNQNGGGSGALGFSTDGGTDYTFLTPTTASPATGNTTTPSVGTYTLPAALTNITTPVVFQLYLLVPGGDGYADGAYSRPGTTTLDVEVDGAVVPAATPTPTPEPGTWAMMIVGAGLLVTVQRARRRIV